MLMEINVFKISKNQKVILKKVIGTHRLFEGGREKKLGALPPYT